MQKPRLLLILNRLAIGGPATDLLSAAAALSADFEILLLAGEPMPDEQPADFLLEEYRGFNVRKIPSLRRSLLLGDDIRAYYHIKQIITEFQPAIVHTHGAKPGVLGRWAAWRSGVPVILHTFHGHVFHSYFNSFVSRLIAGVERRLAAVSTAVIAINQTLQKELVNQYRIAAADKVKLIRLGIETNRFLDLEGDKRSRFRHAFLLGEQDLAIGIAGRLVPVKQHRLFIAVAEQVWRQSGGQRQKFFIVGDGPEKQALQQLLKKKQLSYTDAGALYDPSALFVFTSWRQDMDVVYAGLDLVLLTSLNEGTPVSLMEAMAAGKAVVSTPVGGVRELIEEGRTGFTAEDQQVFAERVLSLVRSPQLREETGSNAAAFASVSLSKAKEVEELKAFYFSLLPVPKQDY